MALAKEQRRSEEARKRKADRVVLADNLKRQKAAEQQIRKRESKAGLLGLSGTLCRAVWRQDALMKLMQG